MCEYYLYLCITEKRCDRSGAGSVIMLASCCYVYHCGEGEYLNVNFNVKCGKDWGYMLATSGSIQSRPTYTGGQLMETT
jgi:hypothetical protein